MVGVLHLLTLKIEKTLNKSFAKLYQASIAFLRSQNRESIGNSLFIHCTLVKKQGTGLGGDISISKVVESVRDIISKVLLKIYDFRNLHQNIFNSGPIPAF